MNHPMLGFTRFGFGGFRVGAGRRSTGHVRLQLSISPAKRKKIESIAKLKNISLSEAVEQLAVAV